MNEDQAARAGLLALSQAATTRRGRTRRSVEECCPFPDDFEPLLVEELLALPRDRQRAILAGK